MVYESSLATTTRCRSILFRSPVVLLLSSSSSPSSFLTLQPKRCCSGFSSDRQKHYHYPLSSLVVTTSSKIMTTTTTTTTTTTSPSSLQHASSSSSTTQPLEGNDNVHKNPLFSLQQQHQQQQQQSYQSLRFCDIGANLLDDRYSKGIYRGTYRHIPDIEYVIQRAINTNIKHIIITAGTIDESRQAIQQTRIWNQQYCNKNIKFSCTVGVHPTRCSEVFCHPDIIPIITTTTSSSSLLSSDDITNTTTLLEYASIEEKEKQELYANSRIQELYDLCYDGISDNTVIAYGECGLDYDRIEFCNIHIQQYYFQKQLYDIALPFNLPLFLHNRNTNHDLYISLRNIQDQYHILKQTMLTDDNNIDTNDNTQLRNEVITSGSSDHVSAASLSLLSTTTLPLQQQRLLLLQWDGKYRGVVHSFDDTIELAMLFIQQLQLYIGINGCSLRTIQNIQTIQQLPLNRILLETDCPYCDVRSTHAGYQYMQSTRNMNQNSFSEKKFVLGQMVKSRQEPCHIIQIAEMIANIQNVDLNIVAETCYNNSIQLFNLQE